MKWSASREHNPAETKQQESMPPQGSMWHNKTKSSLVKGQNQSLKRIVAVLVR